jgi:hypothetical protein
VDGTVAGTGTTLNYAFSTFGPHNVCLIVSGTMPDGSTCKRDACYEVYPPELCPDPCTCQNIQPNVFITPLGCNRTFDGALSTVPACLQNVTYKWFVGITGSGTVSPVGTGISMHYTFAGSGNYTVCLMISGNLPDGTYCEKLECKDIQVNCNFIQQPGGENLLPPNEEGFKLYPNPASDHLTIEMQFEEAAEVQIIMRSSHGKELLNESRKAESGLQRFDLKIPASVVNSMVFIEFITNGTKITRMVNIIK